MNLLKSVGIFFCAVAVLLIGWIVVRRNAPPLRLARSGNEIMVDVQTLGEYPTTVTRIRLSEVSQSKIVWEVEVERGTPQIHEFSLRPDDNAPALEPQYGDYRVVAPKGDGRFVLRKGVRYRIEVWGGKTDFTKRSATFSFAG